MNLLRVTAALAVTAVLAAGCATSGDASDTLAGSEGSSEAWTRVADAPLSPRDHAVVIEVGHRMLVVGGWEFLCPPSADCSTPEGDLLADGAVYDPATDRWVTIAPPPFGVRRAEYATAAIGDTAYLLTGCADGPMCDVRPRLLSYDVADDRWTDHGPVPGPKSYRHLIPLGDELLVYSATDEYGEFADLVFDPERSTWSELPDDPLPRSFDRFVVPVGDQLVLAGSSMAALDSGDDASKLAARFDPDARKWTALPDAPGQGYQLMRTAGGALLNGHFIDSPGWLLDPDSWTWSRLPDQPGGRTDLGGVLDPDGAMYDIPNSVGQMASTMRLYVYDTAADEFVTIPAPPGREDVYDDSSTALGRDLFVYGGQRWTGDGLDGDGELVGDAWLWRAPVG
ncbi:MAG: Kelch repeat-containing protein [Nocardioides sp.]